VVIAALGRVIGEVLEMLFMLAAIVASAWLTVWWCLGMGIVSLSLVLLAELGLSPFLRGSVQAWVDSFTSLTFALSVVLGLARSDARISRSFQQTLLRGFIGLE